MGSDIIGMVIGNKEAKILSTHLRKLTAENDFSKLVLENGYEDLKIPDIRHPTWLIHLVLIYFKRFYCDKGTSEKYDGRVV